MYLIKKMELLMRISHQYWCWNDRLPLQKYGPDYELTDIDKEKKVATFKNGQKIEYDAIISTAPLDITLTWLGQGKVAERLEHRSVLPDFSPLCSILGVGNCLSDS